MTPDALAGYRRSHLMTERLSAAVVAALRMHPTQRLGQFFCNVVGVHNPIMWNTTDEDLVEKMAAMLDDEDLDVWGCEYAQIAGGGCALAATAESPPPTSVQFKDLLLELDEMKQELSRQFNKNRQAMAVVAAARTAMNDGFESIGSRLALTRAINEFNRETS